MVYLVQTNEHKTGYIKTIATFKKKYKRIPEIMLKTGTPLTQKIWVMGMYYCDNGYRTPFKCLFKGTLLEWFQKHFIPYFRYDDRFNYIGSRRESNYKPRDKSPIKQRKSNLHFDKPIEEETITEVKEPHRFSEIDYLIATFK